VLIAFTTASSEAAATASQPAIDRWNLRRE